MNRIYPDAFPTGTPGMRDSLINHNNRQAKNVPNISLLETKYLDAYWARRKVRH